MPRPRLRDCRLGKFQRVLNKHVHRKKDPMLIRFGKHRVFLYQLRLLPAELGPGILVGAGLFGAAGGVGAVGLVTDSVPSRSSDVVGAVVDGFVSVAGFVSSDSSLREVLSVSVGCVSGFVVGRGLSLSEPLPVRGDVGDVTLSRSRSFAFGGFEPSRERRPIVMSSSGTSLALAGMDAAYAEASRSISVFALPLIVMPSMSAISSRVS